ncbi:phosphatase PAP2 family protein [Streptomyces sp. bgisy060]|uniref:phosphatase PAP2 family protein n=1 Tax=Streptomyces sp. bgisy060 TaxID=3413775 RepID=UPI003EBE1F32
MPHSQTAATRAGGARWRLPAATALVCSALLGALVVATVSAHGAPFGADRALHGWAVRHRPSWAVGAAVAVTVTGSGVPAYLLAAFGGALARPGARWLGALAGALALVSVQVPRIALACRLARPRPPAADWAWTASGHALPSGHTTTSAAVAALLTAGAYRAVRGRARRPVLMVPVLWAVAVGASRVYLGMHWPTDVLAGWLLTASWAGLSGMFLVLLRCRKTAAAPSVEGEGP